MNRSEPSRKWQIVSLVASSLIAAAVLALLPNSAARGTKRTAARHEVTLVRHDTSQPVPALRSVDATNGLEQLGDLAPPTASQRDMQGAQNGEVRSDNLLQMPFIWCEPNSFLRGSPANEPRRRPNEGPVEVTVTNGYWLSQYEVTQEQWEEPMGSQPSAFSTTGRGWSQVRGMATDQFPAESISWDDAIAFCEQLTANELAAGRLAKGWH
jgi:formylglycine-generating enzyme required for sulfatase activity